MKELTIIRQAKPAKLEEIEAFELQHSIRLPADFKQFLTSVNPIDEGFLIKIEPDLGEVECW